MSVATELARIFAFTDHLPRTPYHCLFVFNTSRALSASLTRIF